MKDSSARTVWDDEREAEYMEEKWIVRSEK